MVFNDIIDPLYGKIRLPSFIRKLLVCPELLRLKEIRMSNINFFNFTGFSDSTRYEHAIGTAYLAHEFAISIDMPRSDALEFITAALFHDIATPPFGHITEAVYRRYFGFDHEEETALVILGRTSRFRKTDIGPIYADAVPTLKHAFHRADITLSIDNVFQYILGRGKYGRLIKGDIDLDNIDNVYRALHHIGLDVPKDLPLRFARAFTVDETGSVFLKWSKRNLVEQWLSARNHLYTHLLLNKLDLNRESMLKFAIRKSVELHILKAEDWKLTDSDLISTLASVSTTIPGESITIRDLINRIRLGIVFKEIGCYWILKASSWNLRDNEQWGEQVETELSALLGSTIVVNVVPDKRCRLIGNFGLLIEVPLFKPLLQNGRAFEEFGKDLDNALICVYSVRPTILMYDSDRNIMLDDHSKQIKRTQTELRNDVLRYLDKKTNHSNSVKVFTPDFLEL